VEWKTSWSAEDGHVYLIDGNGQLIWTFDTEANLITIVRQKFIDLIQGRPWASPVHISMWSKGS
jgi:hypothetical protein